MSKTATYLRDYKPPYFRWFETDFLADVHHLNWLQRYMYRALLQSMFNCDTRPYLPNDDTKLWKLAGAESLKLWRREKESVLEKFKPITLGGQKLLRNKRVDEEWDIMMMYLDRASKASKASAAKRRQQAGTKLEPSRSEVGAVLGDKAEAKAESESIDHKAIAAEPLPSASSPASKSKPTPSPQKRAAVPTERGAESEKLSRLVKLVEQRLGTKQSLDGDAAQWAEKLHDVSDAEIAALFEWAAAHDWWSKNKIFGRYAVNGFMRNLATIKQQQQQKPGDSRGLRRGSLQAESLREVIVDERPSIV